MIGLLGSIWLTGAIVAFILTCYLAYKESSDGKCIEDFTVATPIISFISWVGVFLLIYAFYRRKFEKF